MTNPIGILLGRLSAAPAGRAQAFPWTTWPDEFRSAQTLGFDAIEWLVTAEALDRNPLLADDGRAEIRRAMAVSGIAVPSVCADFLIEQPLVGVTEAARAESVRNLERVIDGSVRLHVGVVLVPLLEGGHVRDERDAEIVLECLAGPLALAARHGLQLALETDLPVPACLDVIERSGSGALGVYYDTGNAAALGCDAAHDIARIGSKLFGVHIKDRRKGSGSVPLGQGDTAFPACFAALADAGFHGSLILETPVGTDPLGSARAHLQFVMQGLASVSGVLG